MNVLQHIIWILGSMQASIQSSTAIFNIKATEVSITLLIFCLYPSYNQSNQEIKTPFTKIFCAILQFKTMKKPVQIINAGPYKEKLENTYYETLRWLEFITENPCFYYKLFAITDS